MKKTEPKYTLATLSPSLSQEDNLPSRRTDSPTDHTNQVERVSISPRQGFRAWREREREMAVYLQ